MREVEPKVYLIAETKVDRTELRGALRDLGGQTAIDWFDRIDPTVKSDGELAIEVAGRTCYKSFGIGLNPNITKIRQSSEEYIENTLAKGDGSIFEHASATFMFLDVSRVFTHELVRHRVGTAISQESLRYVRPSELGMWIPKELDTKKEEIIKIVESIQEGYRNLESSYDWDRMDFAQKKVVTSALRRIMPQGMATNIVWTANHRTIRHVLQQRTSEGAEKEIRVVFDKVADIVTEKFPIIYHDWQSTPLDDGTKIWTPKYVKV